MGTLEPGREGNGLEQQDAGNGYGLTCVALATGMKCLPHAKLAQAQGDVLHDWHAEVLALRGFNRWILDECLRLARDKNGNTSTTEWVQRTRSHAGSGNTPNGHESADSKHRGPPFELKPNISIQMYCSAAPCGDASMEILMRSRPDSTPWTHPAPSANPDDMIGRGPVSYTHLTLPTKRIV